MYELIRVGNDKLIGEIIRLEGDSATIQVRALTGKAALTVFTIVDTQLRFVFRGQRAARGPARSLFQLKLLFSKFHSIHYFCLLAYAAP